MSNKKNIVFDIECYSNYFLACFMDIETDKIITISKNDNTEFNIDLAKKIMLNYKIITFNGLNYDLPMICAAINRMDCSQLKSISDELIESQKTWEIIQKYGFNFERVDHLDLMPIAPGQSSLKLYAARLNIQNLQDLPYEPSKILSQEEMQNVESYCLNDLKMTKSLYLQLLPQIDLRNQMSQTYNIDLNSKSDAQIAETVLKREFSRTGGNILRQDAKPGDQFTYNPPQWIEFNDGKLSELHTEILNSRFTIDKNGKPTIPEYLSRSIDFNGSKYKIGIGGLHSCEKAQTIIPNKNEILFDADFSSYYPSIILTQKYYPTHLGINFLDVYKKIVDRRLEAKANGDKVVADSLKIVINSSFGKFGNKYSFLYSPKLLTSVTLTGQLALLMLIEKVTEVGGNVVSANTDGIVVLCSRDLYNAVIAIMFDFELVSGFQIETTEYKSLHSQSVNSYIAVKDNGETKGKGVFATPSLSKNPSFSICIEALTAYLSNNVAIEQTISTCEDVTKFLSVRKVGGGGIWNDNYLGKVVRYYISNISDQPIRYVTNGNKVQKTDSSVPLMNLSDKLPDDLDMDFYIKETSKILKSLTI